MKGKTELFKTTVIGGIVFLVPIVILIAIIDKAFEIMKAVSTPLASSIPIDTVWGLAVANLIAIVAIVLICFVAGLLARTSIARRFVSSTENRLLSRLPAYAFVKNMTERVAGFKEAEGLIPVLAPSGGGWRLAFEIERIEGGHVAVFLPGSPNPWSGFVCIMPEDRIKPLDIPQASVIGHFEGFGKGSNELRRHSL
jgi:uncharacterized membrane protein